MQSACQKSVLFQIIQFSISILFSSIWPIDRTLSGATTLSQSGPGSDSNKGVLCIPQSSTITRTSQSDCLVSYPEHLLERGVLPLCRETVGVFYNPSWLRNLLLVLKCFNEYTKRNLDNLNFSLGPRSFCCIILVHFSFARTFVSLYSIHQKSRIMKSVVQYWGSHKITSLRWVISSCQPSLRLGWWL